MGWFTKLPHELQFVAMCLIFCVAVGILIVMVLIVFAITGYHLNTGVQ
jgi:hypothetical protein